MDIQRFFDRLYDEGKKLELLENELRVMEARIKEAGGVGGSQISGGGSGGSKPRDISDLFISEAGTRERVERQTEKVEKLRTAADVMIDQLPEELQKTVMRQRYFRLWPWKVISMSTEKSISYVKMKRAEAIEYLRRS